MTTKTRVAIVADFAAEEWASMDLVADMLHAHLRSADRVESVLLRPKFLQLLTRIPIGKRLRIAHNLDRILNRFAWYPLRVARLRGRFDVFHVVDHSYAQLIHQLPANRTVVTCHDIDTFRPLLEPQRAPRSWLFRAMTARILSGLRNAAMVICPSRSTRDALLEHQVVSSDRVVVIPNGVHPAFKPNPDEKSDVLAERLLGPRQHDALEVVHVGSTIPRKRIDVLLRSFAEMRRQFPRARLVRVGGRFTPAQADLARDLGISAALVVMPPLGPKVLASVYRRAALLMLPSDAEGFGLPLIEAMACGTPGLASDLPALREVGGDAAAYCPVGDVRAWSTATAAMLRDGTSDTESWRARREAGIVHARSFKWSEYAARAADLYENLARMAGERAPMQQAKAAEF